MPPSPPSAPPSVPPPDPAHPDPPAVPPPGLVAGLVERMKTDITGGAYPAGGCLPSTRALAAELGVSRGSLTLVYEQLAAEGYITTRPGARATVAQVPSRAATPDRLAASGPAAAPRLSRVADRLLQAAPPPAWDAVPDFDFRYGALADEDFPKQAWRRLIVQAVLQRQTQLSYGEPAGQPALREALWAHLRRARGLRCEPTQIHIVQGSQQALDLCARLLLDPGDAVGMENPGYPMAARAFEAAGARLLDLPVDEHGAMTDALDRFARARLLFLTPSHQYPLGGILPIGRRLQVLEWAARHDAHVIEDDYDGEYRHGARPVDALHALDGGDRVLYVGTLSKTLSPQLRLGYVVVPVRLVEPFARLKNVSDRAASRLEQLALASFITHGGYEQHVRRMRRRNARRREALISSLHKMLADRVGIQGTEAGLHVVMWLPGVPHTEEAALAHAARRAGIGLYPIGPLFRGPRPDRYRDAGFVIGYASLSVERIREGIAALAPILGVTQARPRQQDRSER